MTPATLELLVAFFTAAVKEAPQLTSLVINFKNFVTGLFTSGLITYEQQQRVWDHVNQIAEAVYQGLDMPEWKVDPDPVTTVPVPVPADLTKGVAPVASTPTPTVSAPTAPTTPAPKSTK